MALHKRLTGRGALAVLVFALACGDDDAKESDAQLPATGSDATVPAPSDRDAGGAAGPGSLDATVQLDANVGFDAAPVTTERDGTVDPTAVSDAAQSSQSDASEASDASQTSDAAQASDGALSDAGACAVRDPRFGCGQVRGGLVEYESGYTVDSENDLVWAPVVPMQSDNEHSEGCGGTSFDGVAEFTLPSIDQVRTLAAGCSASCDLSSRLCVGSACNDECEPCATNRGPHAGGGYCRAELAACSAIFTRDACNIGPRADCEGHQHWYYDATRGVFDLVEDGMQVAGRCVAALLE